MVRKLVYLDNAATTKVDEKVLKAMYPYYSENYANPSSKSALGMSAKEAILKSKKLIAEKIGAKQEEIIFTSGGTEANNLALKGLFFAQKQGKNHIITTKIEHDSILNTCKWLESKGAKVTYLNVNSEGFIDVNDIEKSITQKTFLISVIHANNEIGTIQDIEQIGKLCKSKGVLFHTDACQSFTKVLINVNKQVIDLMTLNAHKIHGPKGIGALYVREGINLVPLVHGGGQERGLRSGTENVPGIVGFAKATELASQKDIDNMRNLRDKLINELLKIKDVKINGSLNNRLCNNINVSFKGVNGETLISYLENEGIYCSAGSACMSNTSEKSHVLRALGLNEKEIESSLRISLSKYTTEKEIKFFLEKLKEIVKKLRNF
ncbi:MAG: cysteine desulfurase family protein [Candidatus Pacearchaeota archaeon]